MERSERLQVATLWFAVLIFLQTASGGSGNPILTGIGIVAILLSYLLPLYLVADLAAALLGD